MPFRDQFSWGTHLSTQEPTGITRNCQEFAKSKQTARFIHHKWPTKEIFRHWLTTLKNNWLNIKLQLTSTVIMIKTLLQFCISQFFEQNILESSTRNFSELETRRSTSNLSDKICRSRYSKRFKKRKRWVELFVNYLYYVISLQERKCSCSTHRNECLDQCNLLHSQN